MRRRVVGAKLGEALRGQACKRAVPFLFLDRRISFAGWQRPERNSPEERGAHRDFATEGKRKLTESAKEFPKASAWQSPIGPFREAMERRALPPRFRFLSEFSLDELTPSAERRSLSLALAPHKEESL
jgi:hypothetical protein